MPSRIHIEVIIIIIIEGGKILDLIVCQGSLRFFEGAAQVSQGLGHFHVLFTLDGLLMIVSAKLMLVDTVTTEELVDGIFAESAILLIFFLLAVLALLLNGRLLMNLYRVLLAVLEQIGILATIR